MYPVRMPYICIIMQYAIWRRTTCMLMTTITRAHIRTKSAIVGHCVHEQKAHGFAMENIYA